MVHRFQASRFSPGNRLFPTVLEVTHRQVRRIKPSMVGHVEESISIRQVSSVTIARGAVWSDIIVHSSGGTDPLRSHGHPNAEAERLKQLIEEYQANIAQTGVADTSGLRAGQGRRPRLPLLRRQNPDRAHRGSRRHRRARRAGKGLDLELTNVGLDGGADQAP
ncbi:MAG: hypothetical protein E6J72_06055 [Deltaproteobacteria bacterium]|nr:MAG: hypothetical protein E6J72_06055 [Deltaproteobacteria bacterium]